jgi:hypothetical protein
LCLSGRIILPAACSAFHGRMPCSRSATMQLVIRLLHGLCSSGFAKQRRRLPARRRDGGVQAERGFAGNRLHGAGARCEGGGIWAEALIEGAEGLAP